MLQMVDICNMTIFLHYVLQNADKCTIMNQIIAL